jgi:flavin reductase (DIM6/NTAB) family NADH-FMN oxidoreductase RutF
MEPALFRETLGHFPTGVVIVAAIDETGEPTGMVVGSFTSVSLDPPLVAYLPTRTSGSYARLRTSDYFCVNILAADQQELCARFASRIPDKFEGVEWRPAESGSPILAGAVGWIDCRVKQEVEGGDHMIVIADVLSLAVERPTLPLVFFQGGYGRFALPSPVSPSDPELIEAAQMAEAIRGPLEALAARIGADSTVMARVGDEAVFLDVNSTGPSTDTAAVGHRIPLLPPLGTALLAKAPEHEIERWLDRSRATDEEKAGFRSNLASVRYHGYSLSLVPPDLTDRIARMSDYSGTNVTPLHDRRVRQMITESASLYEPMLDPRHRYDLHSVVVPVPTTEPRTRLALRLTRLPRHASVAQIEEWTTALGEVAAVSAVRLQERQYDAVHRAP